jgi:hypothetical protein
MRWSQAPEEDGAVQAAGAMPHAPRLGSRGWDARDPAFGYRCETPIFSSARAEAGRQERERWPRDPK